MELIGEETQALEVTPSWILLWGGGVGGGCQVTCWLQTPLQLCHLSALRP